VKSAAKGNLTLQEGTDHLYSFVDEILEEAVKSSTIYEFGQEKEINF
jgi:hypothetical protein